MPINLSCIRSVNFGRSCGSDRIPVAQSHKYAYHCEYRNYFDCDCGQIDFDKFACKSTFCRIQLGFLPDRVISNLYVIPDVIASIGVAHLLVRDKNTGERYGYGSDYKSND
jgi:hypothetical protein